MRANRTRHSGGLTLIEVLIASVILGAGLLALAAMQLHALSGGRSGSVDTYATTLANNKLEELRRIAWSDSSLNPTGNWTTANTVTSPHQGQSYLVDWRVDDVVSGWTRSIDVRVRWSTPERPNRERIVTTMRFNREGA